MPFISKKLLKIDGNNKFPKIGRIYEMGQGRWLNKEGRTLILLSNSCTFKLYNSFSQLKTPKLANFKQLNFVLYNFGKKIGEMKFAYHDFMLDFAHLMTEKISKS